MSGTPSIAPGPVSFEAFPRPELAGDSPEVPLAIVYGQAELWCPLVVGDEPASLRRGQLSPSPVLRSGALFTAGGLTRRANDQTVRLLRQSLKRQA